MNKALITGSAGLLGSESVRFLSERRWNVYGIDNNTRAYLFGDEASTDKVRQNLKESYRNYSHFSIDLREKCLVDEIFKLHGPFNLIIHAAAQPAHEWSTNHALEDFELNAKATLILLESYRQLSPQAVFIQVSSSKVYGDSVNHLPLIEYATRYDLPKGHPKWDGEDELMRLDGNLHSLFGASKACADIMAREYGTYFQLPINIFRPVCITGPTQQGVSLHGYLAYLVKCVAKGIEYTINGFKGKQVRDNIHAFDLVNAFYQVYEHRERLIPGEAYNIGGGRKSNNSILEAIELAEKFMGVKANVKYSEFTRRGDHKWCIYSANKFKQKYPEWSISYDNQRIIKELCDAHQN